MGSENLQAFLRESVRHRQNRLLAVSSRITAEGEPIQWELKAITERENAELRDRCIRSGEIDKTLYLQRLCAECVVYPKLTDSRLQASWGVVGAAELLTEMLEPGEYAELLDAVQEQNGFMPVQEMVDTVKNS